LRRQPIDREIYLSPARLLLRLLGTFLAAQATFALFLLLVPLPDPLFPAGPSQVILSASGQLLRVFLNPRQQYQLPLLPHRTGGRQPDNSGASGSESGRTAAAGTALPVVPAKLRDAVVRYEDRRFYSHPGIDAAAVLRALYDNLRAGRRVSGASTITMQVARLAGGRPRTLASKLLEMLQSLKLEALLSKQEILALYLNHAPFGGNIVGFRAASYRYFGKDPSLLTWAEAAALAVLPNAPGLIDPQRNRADLYSKRNRLLRLLAERRLLDGETLERALIEPLPVRLFPFPFQAPHLSEHLHATRPQEVVRTTIEASLQRQVEEVVRYRMESAGRLGVHNAAVLVAETDSGKIRVYVGSSDYYDRAHNGQVDGVQARRSTGSLLKPFLYALAMDEGLLLPETRIQDIPSQFGAFSPQNIDLSYRGLIPAAESLVLSLNVPAVRLLSEYGLERYYHFLGLAGLEGLFRPPQDYGLTLILGGAEASLLELAGLYRGLGRLGLFCSLSLVEGEPERPGLRLISPGASYLVLQILTRLGRPGAEYYWENYQSGRPLSWKTGTSYGQKDAWSIGVNPRWIVAVWVGNFTGEGNANLRSSALAAPLLFDVFNILPDRGREEWFRPPAGGLQPVRLCRETGYRAGPDCPDTYVASAPAGAKPLPQCPYHKKIFVTLDGCYRVNALCWEPGKYREEIRLFYPPAVAQYLRERGQLVEQIPPFQPGFSGTDGLPSLRIVYPEEGAKIWIPRDLDGEEQKLTLRAAHLEPDSVLYWYADNIYLGVTRERHAWSARFSRGRHELQIIDTRGNRASRSFFVASEQ
jgi:penicillin-binding protein 1C